MTPEEEVNKSLKINNLVVEICWKKSSEREINKVIKHDKMVVELEKICWKMMEKIVLNCMLKTRQLGG